jgi:Fe-S cluster assembly protein SufD
MAEQAAAAARNPGATPARSKAEQGLIDILAGASDQLPGTGWVKRVRADAAALFGRTGLPTWRNEAWRYTNLRQHLQDTYALALEDAASVELSALEAALGPLAALDADRLVLVDGRYRPELSRTTGLADAAEFMPLAPLLAKAPSWLESKFAPGRLAATDSVTALNTALMSDGILVKIKPDTTLPRPLLVVMLRAATTPTLTATRNIIAMEHGARATIIEVHIALHRAAESGIVNSLTDLEVADTVHLAHVKLTDERARATLLSHWGVRIGTNATYRAYHLTLGNGGLTRHGLAALLSGNGGSIDVSGAFLGSAASHIDTTLLIDHEAPACTSRELFKGVLADRARGIFQGKVIVRPGAQKSDGKQMAQALLLSPDAEFDSKPELEIFADDVACGHGSTSAEIDEEQVFYLRARGIPEAEARAMLTRAFVVETLDKVEDEALRASLAATMDAWLDQKAAAVAGKRA